MILLVLLAGVLYGLFFYVFPWVSPLWSLLATSASSPRHRRQDPEQDPTLRPDYFPVQYVRSIVDPTGTSPGATDIAATLCGSFALQSGFGTGFAVKPSCCSAVIT